MLSGCGILLGLILWFLPAGSIALEPEHAALSWPSRWRTWWFAALAAVVLVSIPIPVVAIGKDGRPLLRPDSRPLFLDRWETGLHTFTWGAGIKAIE